MVKDAQSLTLRKHQHAIIKKLARYEGTTVVGVMDHVLWKAWEALGYNLSEISNDNGRIDQSLRLDDA